MLGIIMEKELKQLRIELAKTEGQKQLLEEKNIQHNLNEEIEEIEFEIEVIETIECSIMHG